MLTCYLWVCTGFVLFIRSKQIKQRASELFYFVNISDDRNFYTCPNTIKHLGVAINTFNYMLFYEHLIGGVLNFRREYYVKVNGYSNRFWGWGEYIDTKTITFNENFFFLDFSLIMILISKVTSSKISLKSSWKIKIHQFTSLLTN
jgi:hypothetical protein